MGSSQDFDFLQNIWRDFFITIVFPDVKEFELCRGEKTIGDGLHLMDGGINYRMGVFRRERGRRRVLRRDWWYRGVTLFCHNWKHNWSKSCSHTGDHHSKVTMHGWRTPPVHQKPGHQIKCQVEGVYSPPGVGHTNHIQCCLNDDIEWWLLRKAPCEVKKRSHQNFWLRNRD